MTKQGYLRHCSC